MWLLWIIGCTIPVDYFSAPQLGSRLMRKIMTGR
jgi:hypothetical protein